MYNQNMYNNQQNVPPYNNNYYNGTYQPYSPQQQTNNQFVVKNVNSYDEAKNANVDYFNTYIFTDFNNSSIYLKRINNNGLEDFYTFKLAENPPDRIQMMEQRMLNIEEMLGRMINNVPTNEPNDVSTNAQSNERAESSLISKGAGNVTRKK